MRLIVNGKPHEHAGAGRPADLLKEIGADPDRSALGVNDEVIRRADWESVKLREGDRVEVLVFAGGG
jgi:sulfur carrier protein